MSQEPLFHLCTGEPVYRGDVLWHPDHVNVGWWCKAEFRPDEGDTVYVVVRSPNGAVPTVRIADLRKEPPHVRKCSLCGQTLPNAKEHQPCQK